jgi:predicted PurR-regulated permease PerM
MAQANGKIIDGIEKYFQILMLLGLTLVLIMFLFPFVTLLMIAGIVVTAIYPIHRWIHDKFKLPETLSALLTLLLVTIIVVGPCLLIFFSISNQATDAYAVLSNRVNSLTNGDINLIPKLLRESAFGHEIAKLSQYVPISTNDIISAVEKFFGQLSSFLFSKTTDILKNLSLFLMYIMIFFLSLFYMIRDGEKFVRFIYSLIPMSELRRKELFHKLNQVSRSIIYGVFGAALVQGVILGLGFYIVGIAPVLFWSLMAALGGLVPVVGTGIIWIPAVIWLFVTGQTFYGIFLLIYSLVIVSVVDNIIKPYLIGSSTALHPLAVLLVILGGIFMFGFNGVIFGPFILTLVVSFAHIYKLDYRNVLNRKTPNIKAKS